jgi:hypothetical protein
VGAGSGAAAAGSSLIHFPYVAWRGTIGFTRNGSAVGLFEAELCVQQAGWASSAFWSGLPLVLVCSKFLKTTQLWQALREHKARGHRLVGLRYQATKLLPAVHSMEVGYRRRARAVETSGLVETSVLGVLPCVDRVASMHSTPQPWLALTLAEASCCSWMGLVASTTLGTLLCMSMPPLLLMPFVRCCCLPACPTPLQASIRKEENSMVALAGSLGSGVSLYVCMGAEYKPKPGSTGAFNLASNMVILIMPSSEGSSAAAGAGAAVQQQG